MRQKTFHRPAVSLHQSSSIVLSKSVSYCPHSTPAYFTPAISPYNCTFDFQFCTHDEFGTISRYRAHTSSLTFELDLQHRIGVLRDVTIGPESVAGAMHADLQSKVVLCRENMESRRILGTDSFFGLFSSTSPQDHYPSFAFGGKSNKVRGRKKIKKGETGGAPLTSVHQPFLHCIGNIKGDPLGGGRLGLDVLAPDVALFGFEVVFLKDL